MAVLHSSALKIRYRPQKSNEPATGGFTTRPGGGPLAEPALDFVGLLLDDFGVDTGGAPDLLPVPEALPLPAADAEPVPGSVEPEPDDPDPDPDPAVAEDLNPEADAG